jgi:hypothetical protein
MKRPKGVSVLAYLYLLVAFAALVALIPSPAFDPREQPKFAALSAGYLIIAATLAIALLKMKPWSRWSTIAVNVAQLLLIPYAMVVDHGPVAIIRAALSTLFSAVVIWYLTRPHIKAAFKDIAAAV